jgi:predicted aspartyl protease
MAASGGLPMSIKLIAYLSAGALAVPSAAEPPPAPPLLEIEESEEGATALGYGIDAASQRMTVPVSIGESGPHRFIVDTGAERTVIGRGLAGRLRLDAGRTARVHSMTEVSDIKTVVIPALTVGGKEVRGIHAPALSERNLGAEGMLGVDTLQNQRVSFDFARQVMTVVPGRKREEHWDGESIIITARSRLGHLVLVDASVDGQKVWVILDTGSEVTVGNSALRKRLERKKRLKETYPVQLLSVTGGQIVAEQTVVREFRLGTAWVRGMPIAFADVHPFRQLGLSDKPALLLGMDALQLFERVSVDFANRRVRLMTPSDSAAPSGARMAARAPGLAPPTLR